MRLEGQHALVTGGGTGIGAAIAEALEAEGAAVSRIGRRPEKLGPNGYPADVSDRGQVDAAFATARAAHGPISILIPNAGAAESAPFAKTDIDLLHRMLAVNLDGVFHCCQAALSDLVAAERGRIVAVASTASLRGFPYSAAYGTAKHAALGLIRMIAADYAGTGLTANAVCPGYTDTDLVDTAATRVSAMTGLGTDQLKTQFGSFNPAGRLIAPAEVAALVLELILSDRNGEAVVIE
jgi:NAD(P)-dependent dehydrogenase (short-subunit alcohol dehydrogenase family)